MFPYEEPTLFTDPSLMSVLDELRDREPIFHHLELGTTRADFENMMAPDFWEVGASGRRYSREAVLGVLARRSAGEYKDDRLEATDFHCRRLAGDVYLLTYTLFQGERKTRRATIWQRAESGWKIVFHQGTLVRDS
jgi:hypothetical protein